MKKTLTIAGVIGLLSAALFAALIVFRWPITTRPTVTTEYRTDTIVRVDTVVHTVFMPYKVTEIRTDTITVYVEKPLNPGDSVAVTVPVEEVRYRGPDYDLTIGGYRPYLKSLTIYPRTVTVTNTEIQTVTRRNRYGVGVQVGYGITKGGPGPYVGIGLHYTLFGF